MREALSLDVRLVSLRGETGADESKLSCETCRCAERTVATFYFMVDSEISR